MYGPLKFKYANYQNANYTKTGRTSLKFRLINQRGDFSFAFFSGGLLNPKLISVSNFIAFANPKAPLYPRLALGKSWDIMTVTWTSGYNIDEAVPFVEWGWKGQNKSVPLQGHSHFIGTACVEHLQEVWDGAILDSYIQVSLKICGQTWSTHTS